MLLRVFFFWSKKPNEWNCHSIKSRRIGKKHISGEDKNLHFGHGNLEMPLDTNIEVVGITYLPEVQRTCSHYG